MVGLPLKENFLNIRIIKPSSVIKDSMILMETAILQLPSLILKTQKI